MVKKVIMCLTLFLLATLENIGVVEGKNGVKTKLIVPTIKKEEVSTINDTEIIYNNITGTVYHPVPEQTDDTPLITADGSRIDLKRTNELRWIAVSRDLINLHTSRYNFNGKLKFGDSVWIDYDKETILELAKTKKLSEAKTQDLITKCEKIRGWWVVKDTMGDYYWKPMKNISPTDSLVNSSREYKVENDIVYKKHYQRNWIDFLQHPKTGMLHYWNKSLIIAKKKK